MSYRIACEPYTASAHWSQLCPCQIRTLRRNGVNPLPEVVRNCVLNPKVYLQREHSFSRFGFRIDIAHSYWVLCG